MIELYAIAFLILLMLFIGVAVYDSWKKGAQQLIAFSSVAIVMFFTTVLAHPEHFV